jgi:hypothetical protein
MRYHLVDARRGLPLGLLLAAASLALPGCAGGEHDLEHSFLSAENPYYYCRRQGVAPDTAAFDHCLAAVVAARCADADPQAQAHCERHLSDTIRETDALRRRS